MSANVPKCSCSCNEEASPATLVYPCSGAADTGDGARQRGDGEALKRSRRVRRSGRPHRGRNTEQIADRAARRLDAKNVAWMSCLAGIGGRVSGMMANAAAAPALLAIDGCPLDCAKKTLELAGFANVKHVRVTDLGFKKGKTPASDKAIRQVADAAAALLKN